MKRTDGQKRLSARLTHRKAFTLVELLVVIAIIGILFVVLISKVDFATEKAKATGVQTDFRSYQLAIETVARENAGLSTLVDDDASGEEKYAALEAALNKNLDPKLRVEIDADGKISTDAKDPWKEEYTGQYLAPDADGTVKDRGAIVMYCKGSNLKLGTTSETVNGVVNVTIESGKEKEGADDYAISTIYTYVNGYGEIQTKTEGFSNDIGDTNNTPSDKGESDNVESDKIEIVEIWIVEGGTRENLANLFAEQIGYSIDIRLVDELPETMPPMDEESQTLYAHVLKSTGVVYGNMNGTVMTAGQLLWEGAEDGTVYDKGWTDDINSETEDGIYCVRTYVDVVEPGTEEIVEFWFVENGRVINYTYVLSEQGLTINTHLVDALPETLIESDDVNGVAEVYVVESTGVGYLNIDGSVATLGQYMVGQSGFDSGWSEDIYSEIENGIYCVRVEVVESAEIWMISGGVASNFTNLVMEDGAIVNVHLIDVLPETLIPSDMENMVINVYVLENTGIAYINMDGTVISLGQLMYGQDNYDCGWTTNINAETEDGFYCARAFEKLGQKPSQVVAGFYNANGHLLVNWDTVVAAYGMNVEKDYGRFNENENYHETDTASPYYIITNKLPATTKVVISDTVTKIGNCAFYDCSRLTSVTLGSSLTSIGEYVFYHCTGLTSIEIPGSVTSIGDSAFSNCFGLTSVDLGSGVISIGSSAFYYCSKLASVEIPGSVTSVGDYAFCDCPGLTSIVIPDSVANIGKSAFLDCSGLTSLTIGRGVTSIGEYAFDNCHSLVSIAVDDNNTAYCDDGNCLIERATGTLIKGCNNSVIPTDGSIIRIGYGAFQNCTGLTSITIPDSVTEIGNGVFLGCTGLTSVTIPDGVTAIGGSVFLGCTGLTSITIPDSVTEIGYRAFAGCTGLTSITIPNSVTSIETEAFYNCTNLAYTVYDNAYYLGNETNPYLYLVKSTSEDIVSCVIHENTKFIGSSAFKNCTGLTSITIPNSVTNIGDYAFHSCSELTSITLKSTTLIPHNPYTGSLLTGCLSLTAIYVPADLVNDYKSADGWRNFASKIQAIPTT